MSFIGMYLVLAVILKCKNTRIFCAVMAVGSVLSVYLTSTLCQGSLQCSLGYYSYQPLVLAGVAFCLLSGWIRGLLMCALILSVGMHQFTLVTASPLILLWYSDIQVVLAYISVFILSSQSIGWMRQVPLLLIGGAMEYYLPRFL